MKLLAIDPGTFESAWVAFDGQRVLGHGLESNVTILGRLREYAGVPVWIEMVASFGMPVGKEVFETCVWIGRFWETALRNGSACDRVTRHQIKLHLCHSARAKDTNVRQAILDRFGGKLAALGNKKNRGPLYGVVSHEWSALAVALYGWDTTPTHVRVGPRKCNICGRFLLADGSCPKTWKDGEGGHEHVV